MWTPVLDRRLPPLPFNYKKEGSPSNLSRDVKILNQVKQQRVNSLRKILSYTPKSISTSEDKRII